MVSRWKTAIDNNIYPIEIILFKKLDLGQSLRIEELLVACF